MKSKSDPRSKQHIIDVLCSEINSKALPPGTRMPTSAALAERFQVSVRTADRAMSCLVKHGWIERIPGNGSFVKNNRPAALRPKVALISRNVDIYNNNELNKAAFGYVKEQLKRELEHLGYNLDIFNVTTSDLIAEKIPVIEAYKYDLIVTEIYQICENISSDYHHTPLIVVGGDMLKEGNFHQVYHDSMPGFKLALDAGLQAKFRKFAIIGCQQPTKDDTTQKNRINAAVSAAKQLGIKEENLLVYCEKNPLICSPIIAGVHAAEYILQNNMTDHLLLVTSDYITYGMMDVFNRAGLQPGVDYHLISYDNTEERNTALQLGITAISHPLDNMVRATLQMIEDNIRAPSKGVFYRAYRVPADKIVYRKSFQKKTR